MAGADRCLVRAEQISTLPEFAFRHPLNPRSELYLRSLSALTGLQRLGFHLGRVPPGKESFIYHQHQFEEEFIYILSGRGVADIADESVEVGPGDFMGFTARSSPHHLRNPFEVDLLYLMGGEHREVEIADLPRVKKKVITDRSGTYIVDAESFRPF